MVYEPREDSYLLLDEIKKINLGKFLEIGCGSGLISIEAAKKGADVTAVDIDKEAVEFTKKEAEKEGVKIDVFISDLFENVKGKFDTIVFNFPYIPEEITEENRQWAAGKNLEIIKKFASEAKNYLKNDGKILFVISSITGPEKVMNIFHKNGFKLSILKEKKIPFETLYLIKAIL